MSYYAFINEHDVVVEVITGVPETELIEGKDPEVWYGEFRRMNCKRTSTDPSFRKNFASIGDTYDKSLDAFISPKPFPSWVLETNTAKWQAPVKHPDDNLIYKWNEESQAWDSCSECNQKEQNA